MVFDELQNVPIYSPLLAAVVAPFCTLFDIPALSERWFMENGNQLPDPGPNLILSSTTLGLSFIANILLLVRFSIIGKWWRLATTLSTACWTIKFIIGLANVVTFGFVKGNRKGVSYDEGFWCALVSLAMTAVIMGLLLSHYIYRLKTSNGSQPTERQIEARIAGRHFMIQTTLFVCTTAILALYMSRLEHWSYLQGIYFAIVSFLTIGFGDFVATKTATQIVLFPFLVIGIVQLACLIGMLVNYFSQRIASQRADRRRRAAMLRQEEQDKLSKEPNLEKEMEFLIGLYRSTNQHETAVSLAMASVGFLSFWLIGALVFSRVESWTYGQGLYFCYVFFLAVGYGDFAPITPAGRVILTVYAIIAVPIMTSFAVETIQGITRDLSNRLLERRKAKYGLSIRLDLSDGPEDLDGNTEKGEGQQAGQLSGDDLDVHNVEGNEKLPKLLNWDRPHTEFIDRAHKQLDDLLQQPEHGNEENERRLEDEKKLESEHQPESKSEETSQLSDMQNVDRLLMENILELAISLEQHARRLLLSFTDDGSDIHILLKADRLVQLQNIRSLAFWEDRADDSATNSNTTWDGAAAKKDAIEQTQSSKTPPTSRSERNNKIGTLMKKYYEEEFEISFPSDLDQKETIEEVMRYREALAGLLAAGSRLMKLKEDEQLLFERRAKHLQE